MLLVTQINVGNSGLGKIPQADLTLVQISDGKYYLVEMNIVHQHERVKLVLRCTSGGELYIPKMLHSIFAGKKVKIKIHKEI